MNLTEALEAAKERHLSYVAMDADGAIYGYKERPVLNESKGLWANLSPGICRGLGHFTHAPLIDYTTTLREVDYD